MWLSIALGALACAGCRAAEEGRARRFEFSRLAMGVEARLVLYCAGERPAIEAADAAFDAIAALEDVMSDWRASSELSRLARAAGTGPVHVSGDLFEVLRRARDMALVTHGAFDPTVGPLVALERRARASGVEPDAARMAEARALVGIRFLELDETRRTAALAQPGMRLDLGAIGKGFACQRALLVLARHGVESALVEMGGDLACSSPPPGRLGWSIDLASVAAESNGERLVVAHRAVSTSGDREQFAQVGPLRRSHVIDPRTGASLTNRVRAIVVASDGAASDALATALGVLGAEQGIALLARVDGCEGWIEETRDGLRVERSTPGFRAIPREFRAAR